MASMRDRSLLVRAATLYYVEGKSQAEVATAIGVSRSNVSRVLSAARQHGIVEIKIHDPFGRAEELEDQLMARFGLTGCRVAPSVASSESLSRVGELGAAWLLENLPTEGSIALSWGSSVQAVVDSVSSDPVHNALTVLPLVGGLSMVDSARDGNVLVRSLAMKLGAEHRPLHAPAIVESKSTRDAFLAEPSINAVLTAASNAKLAVVGIGSVGTGASQSIIDAMELTPVDLAEFHRHGPVGDCCTRYYDRSGRAVESPVQERVVSIDLESLGKVPTLVGVAGGVSKAAGVHGALAGGLIDVLVVDSLLAQAVLAYGDQ